MMRESLYNTVNIFKKLVKKLDWLLYFSQQGIKKFDWKKTMNRTEFRQKQSFASQKYELQLDRSTYAHKDSLRPLVFETSPEDLQISE